MSKNTIKLVRCEPSTSTATTMTVLSDSSADDNMQIVPTTSSDKPLALNLTRREKLIKLSRNSACQVGTPTYLVHG